MQVPKPLSYKVQETCDSQEILSMVQSNFQRELVVKVSQHRNNLVETHTTE